MITREKLKKTAVHIYKNMQDSEIQLLGPSMAFMSILSIIPIFAVSIFMFQLFGGADRLLVLVEPQLLTFFKFEGVKSYFGSMQPVLLSYLTDGLNEKIMGSLKQILDNIDAQSIGLIGIGSLVLTSLKLLSDVDRAIQKVWRIKHRRSLKKRISVYLVIILFGPVTLGLLLGFLSSGVIAYFKLTHPMFGVSVGLLATFFPLFLIYKMVPFARTRYSYSIIAAALTTFSLYIVKTIYFLIMKNLIFYNKIYGSLASLPLFLVWVLIIWMVVLSGAVFSATLHDEDVKN
ncbi:MAG: YihY family inner membrane protein [Bdellovibrionaceae bacterium]|mgnify:CR=1 FL=1|jgi:membrane protein|nr:YihY family inner membrane protein [Pseudobdellovibrionaceae bacterium]